jgi:hypothetical protein
MPTGCRLSFVEEPVITALEPVLADVRRAGLGVSLSRGELISDRPGLSRAIVWAHDGSGTGVQVYVSDSRAAQVAALASTVQDIVVEDFLLAPWPTCPHHPKSGHPLLATVEAGAAVWKCPSDNSVISGVGTLPRPHISR